MMAKDSGNGIVGSVLVLFGLNKLTKCCYDLILASVLDLNGERLSEKGMIHSETSRTARRDQAMKEKP